jgi:hypothetical protein
MEDDQTLAPNTFHCAIDSDAAEFSPLRFKNQTFMLAQYPLYRNFQLCSRPTATTQHL